MFDRIWPRNDENDFGFKLKKNSIKNKQSEESLAFLNAFDNPSMPFFAMFILVWGMVFIQCWKRKNAELTFYWNCENSQANELDLPSYTKTKEERNKRGDKHTKWQKFFYRHEASLKFLVSILVFIFMVTTLILIVLKFF